MRGRKRLRKKWLKKNFIEIAPGVFVPSPRARLVVRSAYCTVGAWKEIKNYLESARCTLNP